MATQAAHEAAVAAGVSNLGQQDLGLTTGEESIGSMYGKSQKNREMVAIGMGALVAGAGYFTLSKKMGAKGIAVGLVLGLVAYMAAKMYLPKSTAQNYGV